jgi:hypothetical protein
VTCRLWCVSLPYPQLGTNLMPKRGSTFHQYRRRFVSGATRYRTEAPADISAGLPTGGQVRQVTETPSPVQHEAKNESAPDSV